MIYIAILTAITETTGLYIFGLSKILIIIFNYYKIQLFRLQQRKKIIRKNLTQLVVVFFC